MHGLCSSIWRRHIIFAFLISIISGSAVFPLVASAQSSSDDLLAELIQKNTVARGGKKAIEAVQSLEVELTITEPTFVVDGIYRASRDGKMRIDVFAEGERVFSEGYNDSGGWQWLGGESEGIAMSREGELAVKHGIVTNLYGLHEMAGLGHELVFKGREEVDHVNHWVIDLVFDDGFVSRLYLDPESFLVVLTRVDTALHPDVDPEVRRFETRSFDFRQVSGVLKAFQEAKIDMDSREQVQITLIKTIIINPVLDPAVFDRPT